MFTPGLPFRLFKGYIGRALSRGDIDTDIDIDLEADGALRQPVPNCMELFSLETPVACDSGKARVGILPEGLNEE